MGRVTIEERVQHLYECERDTDYRAAIVQYCTDGADADVFFANVFLNTYDPRLDESGKPIGDIDFLLWPKQEELVRFTAACIDDQHDGAVKKSRDAGATNGTLVPFFRRWLLIPGFAGLIGTLVEDLVDNTADPDSMFYKLDVFLRSIQINAPYLMPRGFNESAHRSFCKLVNPQNGSVISGQAPTPNFGRSGRRTAVLMDEFAFWKFPSESAQSCSGTTKCRLYVSTPNGKAGKDNAYYQMVHNTGEYSNVRVPMFQIHWTDDPRKNVTAISEETGLEYFPWKLEQVGDIRKGIPGRMSDAAFAEEYDIEFERSITGRIYTQQLPHTRRGTYPYRTDFLLYTSWDFGISDDLVIGWWQWDFEQGRYRLVEVYENSGHAISFYIPLVVGRRDSTEILEHEHSYTDKDLETIARRTGWQRLVRDRRTGETKNVVPYTDHFADPDARKRGLSDGLSAKTKLEEAGVFLRFGDTNNKKGYIGRIEESRRILPYTDVNEQHCKGFIDKLESYRMNPAGTAPLRDATAHAASMLQYYAVNDPHLSDWQQRKQSKGIPAKLPGGVFGSVQAWQREQEQDMRGRDDDDDYPRARRPGRNKAGY